MNRIYNPLGIFVIAIAWIMEPTAWTPGSSAKALPPAARKEKHGTARHSASNRSGPAVNADAAMTEPIRSAQAKPRKGFYATTL